MDGLSRPDDTPNAIPLRARKMYGRPRLANKSFSHPGPGGGNSLASAMPVQLNLDTIGLLSGLLGP